MDNDKTYKKADNVIGKKTVKSGSETPMVYSKITNEIDKEKAHIKLIDDIRDQCIDINKRFNRCLDLLSISIRGPKTNRNIDEMMSNNMASIASICDTLDGEKENSKNRLNDLYYKKDHFTEEKKKKSNKKEEI